MKHPTGYEKKKMENLNLPIIKNTIPHAKCLSMDKYAKFVFLHLRYTHDKKEYERVKKASAVTAPFYLWLTFFANSH